jgi:hypothetical protein
MGDVTVPDLTRPSGLQPRDGAWLLGCPCPATAMGLTMAVEHAVEAAFVADIQAPIGKDWLDLVRG